LGFKASVGNLIFLGLDARTVADQKRLPTTNHGHLRMATTRPLKPPRALPRQDVRTFKRKYRPAQDSRSPNPAANDHASAILGEFEQAQTELVGKAVILTDGKAGTVERVWLDELHGLRISIKGQDGKWPVSTIKLAQS
jgi:hypothetical protein